jgi:Glycosyl hydrolase family 99
MASLNGRQRGPLASIAAVVCVVLAISVPLAIFLPGQKNAYGTTNNELKGDIPSIAPLPTILAPTNNLDLDAAPEFTEPLTTLQPTMKLTTEDLTTKPTQLTIATTKAPSMQPTKSVTSPPSHKPTFTPTNEPITVANNKLLYLAYYYPWFIRDDWNRHGHADSPLLGLYGTDEPKVAEQHNTWAKRAGIDVWVVSWWGPDTMVEKHFRSGMLQATNLDPIQFCLHYESGGALPTFDFANGTIAIDGFIKDMKYMKSEYFSHPSYLRVNSRPVVVLYVTRRWLGFKSSMLDRVKNEVGEDIFFIANEPYFGNQQWLDQANNGIKDGKPVFESYTTYNMFENNKVREGETAKDFMFREGLPIFERWSKETIFFPNVLPMYHDFRGHKVLPGNASELIDQLEAFSCLPRPSWYDGRLPDMIFITTWNEWWEGSQVEPDIAGAYGFTFIDALKEFKDTAKQCVS